MKKIKIYTDGACRGNPGPGGWGALLRYGDKEKSIYGAVDHTTNNRMELTAAIEALRAVTEDCIIELYTDSQYVQKGISQWMPNWKRRNWKNAAKKTIANIDLWQLLDAEVQHHNVSWHWVRGHSGHVENEMADALANQAIDEFLEQS